MTIPSYREQAEAVARAADVLSGEQPRLMSTRDVEREIAALRAAARNLSGIALSAEEISP